MKPIHKIQRFEYGRLVVGDEYFEQRHLNALLKLNELHNFEYFDSIPNGIRFKQYVGIIQVDNIAIEIFPKADNSRDENTWRDVLIKMLKKCRKLKASTYGDANVNRQNLNLLEIYFSIYLSELTGLMQQGLVKKYRKEASNINALKGRILFSKHIGKNFIHKEHFFIEHQVYDRDHKLHQILSEALKVVQHFTRGTYLFDKCKRVQLSFPEVTEIRITKELLDCFKLTRKTRAYTKAFEIARLILLNYSPDISSGKERMLALLFDMNKLWEEYVLIKLREAADENLFEVIGQDSMDFWQANKLKPDIVIKDLTNSNILIIDTKWKQPSSSASSQDLRQMYAYNRFWNATKAILLYPGEPSKDGFTEFLNPSDSPKHWCRMAFASVLKDDGTFNESIGHDILTLIDEKVAI